MLKFFSSPKISPTIPTYDHTTSNDSIDLQVKSLLYIFKRLRINRLASFLNREDNSFKYTCDFVPGNDPYFQKLDVVYNVQGFITTITNDEYRVMVDFIKNKFRSWCIVSSTPSQVAPNDTNNASQFPNFVDYKDRPVSKFKFILLPLETSLDSMANILAHSDIYCEHFQSFDFHDRYRFAIDSVRKVITDERFDLIDQYKQIVISELEKCSIIKYYLQELAFNVQLIRIYNESMKLSPAKPTISRAHIPSASSSQLSLSKSPHKKSIVDLRSSLNSSPTRTSRPSSPTKGSRPGSPTKELASRPSTPNFGSRASSPVKQLKSKPSISKLQFEDVYNPLNSSSTMFDTSDTKSDSTSDTSLENHVQKQPIERMDVYEKCKTAINHRLKQEKAKLQ